MVELAIVGTGYIADYHARAVSAAGAELVAVANHRQESMAAFAARHGVPRTYDRLDDLLDQERVDGLIVATPNVLHAEQTVSALARDVSVLLEKPMAMTAAEARGIVAAETSSAGRVMLAHCVRFDDQVDWLRQQVASGAVGRPVRTVAHAVHAGFGPAGWFTDPALAGGGALMDLGVHAIDATRYVLGDPMPVRVSATTGTHYRDLAVDDTASLFVTWSDGVTSVAEAGWWHPYQAGPTGRLQVLGATAFAETFPCRLSDADGVVDAPAESVAELTDAALQRRYDRQMQAFLRVVRGECAPAPSAVDGLVVMRVVDAAYQSAATGGSVPIEEAM